MTTQPSYAGEFFDLSITSINNDYGALHNIGVMLYGINFPLEKFIKELQMILNDEGGGATDDKAQKRQKRLVFLRHCDSLPELQKFFERFCNYLNGKDGSGEQYSNFIVITAAGGNIIIVFAQLIMNIINMVITDKEFLRITFADVILKMCNNNEELATNVSSIILSKMTDPREIAYCILDYHALSTAVIAALKGDPTTIDKIQIIPQTNGDERYTEAYTLHNSKLKSFLDIISLIPTNRTLLDILQRQLQVGADDIVRKIVYHFITNTDMLNVLKEIADSPASDCDFKLSPNIFQTRDQESEFMGEQITSRMSVLELVNPVRVNPMQVNPMQNGGGPVDDYIQQLNAKITQLISELDRFIRELDTSAESEKKKASFTLKKASFTLIIQLLLHVSNLSVSDEKKASFISIIDILYKVIYDNDTSNAGFLLFRAKTIIDCRENYKPRYTPQELKMLKQNCMPKYQKLYPQIIQQKDLDEAVADIRKQQRGIDPEKHPCFLYLNHLMEKKKAIKYSTQETVNQIIQLFVDGYFKQASRTGHMAPLIRPSIYKTEALIAYIRNITLNINVYIHQWFKVNMTSNAAPAKSLLEPRDYDYKSLVELFSSLDTMITNNSLIPFLSADILNYFINDGSFHTETILDELIKNFNANRAAERKSGCVMLPSDILLVPSSYQISLSQIKDVFNDTLHVGLGYPDGLRITINAIITEQIKDITAITSMLLSEEHDQQSIEYKISKFEEESSGPTKTITNRSKKQVLSYKEKTYRGPNARYSQSSQSSQSQPSQSQSSQGGKKYYKKNITFKKKIVKKTNEKLKTKSKKTRRQKNLRKVTLKHKKPRKHKSIKHKYRKHKL